LGYIGREFINAPAPSLDPGLQAIMDQLAHISSRLERLKIKSREKDTFGGGAAIVQAEPRTGTIRIPI
jgi:hypothetical protein